MTRRRMLEEMDAEEWGYWQAFNDLCPVGDDRADVRMATLIATVANLLRDKDDLVTPGETLPDWGGRRAEAEEKDRERRLSRGRQKRVEGAWRALADAEESDGG